MSDHVAPGLSMSCAELVELVTDYLEGVLDDATRAELEAHLALCPGCDTYLEQIRETISRVGHLPVESLSEQAQQDLMAAFRSLRAQRSGTT